MGLFKRVFKWYDSEGRCVEHVEEGRFRQNPDLYDRDARIRGATHREVKVARRQGPSRR